MTAPLRILVLDPSEQAIQDYAAEFAARGWEVIQCLTFLEALPLLEGPPIDLVLIDMALPDILGTEACTFIQKFHPNTVGIITTASLSLYRSIDAIGAGAQAYLLKPLGIPQLCTLIEHLLEQQRARNQVQRIQKQLVGFSNLLSTVSQATTPDQILDKMLSHLGKILHFDLALIYLFDQAQGEWIRHQNPAGARSDQAPTLAQNAILTQLAAQSAEALKPIAITAGTPANSDEKRKLAALNLDACAAIPLISQHVVHGVLVIVNESGSSWELEPLDVEILFALSRSIGVALDRAKLLDGLDTPAESSQLNQHYVPDTLTSRNAY